MSVMRNYQAGDGARRENLLVATSPAMQSTGTRKQDEQQSAEVPRM
jgi:hypothetical protein